MTLGIYAGTFDPLTLGHLDIIERSFSFCDKLCIAIGVNSSKKTFFTEDERELLIEASLIDLGFPQEKFFVSQFQGLLTNFAEEMKANILIRGIRSVSDFEYEINLANINKILSPGLETVFLPTSPQLAVVSSSMVKEIAKYAGDISPFVTSVVKKAVNDKFGFIKHGA
jgi:pantetheine-phosphate adenylyltransferase